MCYFLKSSPKPGVLNNDFANEYYCVILYGCKNIIYFVTMYIVWYEYQLPYMK